MTIDREELRQCPFCGRTDLLGFEPYPGSGFLGVRCRACGCIGKAGRAGPSERTAEAEAAAHWNNQRALDAADRRIAELEKQNDRFVSIIAASDTAQAIAETVDHLATCRLRLQVATDANVADRKRIDALEAGLREALNIIDSEVTRRPYWQESDIDRLRALLSPINPDPSGHHDA